MKTTIEQQTANTLFAFQMALKGHDRFEYFSGDFWLQCSTVNNGFPHRILWDIPAGWVRHDGEDWKGDDDTILAEVMYCDGKVSGTKGVAAGFWKRGFTQEIHVWRIYAYKLAKKVIPRTKEAATLAEIDAARTHHPLRPMGGIQMNYNLSKIRIKCAELVGWTIHPKDRFIVIPPNSPNSVQPLSTIPSFTESADAALQLVAWMVDEMGKIVEVKRSSGIRWIILVTNKGPVLHFSADTFPLAVCLAFLRANGIDPETL